MFWVGIGVESIRGTLCHPVIGLARFFVTGRTSHREGAPRPFEAPRQEKEIPVKTTSALLIPALAALGLAALPGFAQDKNPLARPDAGQARHFGRASSEPRHYGAPTHRGNRWRGDPDWSRYRHHRPWRGHSHWGWGLSFGVPLFWGWPFYDPYFYYPGPYVYRDIEVIPEYTLEPAPETTLLPPDARGAPTQEPLYMNYCESAKAYFPSVTTCPEGWKATVPTR